MEIGAAGNDNETAMETNVGRSLSRGEEQGLSLSRLFIARPCAQGGASTSGWQDYGAHARW